MSRRAEPIRIATRGSELALAQSQQFADALEQRRYTVELVEIETTGDQVQDELIHRLGRTGAFVRALDEHVLDGSVDLAVHSMKDVPTELPADLVIAAVPRRANAADVLVTPDGSKLVDLEDGAIVGTASLRRRAQLLSARPDIEVMPIRGNIDTRIEKLLSPSVHREQSVVEENETETVTDWIESLSPLERRALDRGTETTYDAIVLAVAGLDRTGLFEQIPTVQLSPERFVPAPGQGAIAISMVDSPLVSVVNNILDHPVSRIEVTVERTILKHLGGGCIAPIGIHATTQGEFVHTVVHVFNRDGTDRITGTQDLPVTDYRDAAISFADELADRGAVELIHQARKRAREDES